MNELVQLLLKIILDQMELEKRIKKLEEKERRTKN